MSELLVVARAKIRADKVAEFAAAARTVAEASRQEPGCLEYGLYQSAEDPGVIVSVERWSSRDAIQAHFSAPHTQAFLARVPQLVSEAPSVTLYEAGKAEALL